MYAVVEIQGSQFKVKKDQKLFKLFQIDKKIKQYYFDITNFKKTNNLIKKSKFQKLFIQNGMKIGINKSLHDNIMTFYGDTSIHHMIASRNQSNAEADDIMISSYGAVYIDLDSNNNNSSAADFEEDFM